MTRVATKPMDPAATKAANDAAKAAYPDCIGPGDEDYPAFQKLWMDSYAQNGGDIKDETPEEQQARVKKARDTSKGKKYTAGSTQDCPIETSGEGGEGGEKGKKTGPGTKAGAGKNFTPKEKPCTCKLEGGTVTCSHGRSEQNDLLQIVPKSLAVGDDITVTAKTSGSQCASKFVLRTNGFGGSKPTENKGVKKLKRPTKAPSKTQYSTLGYWKASPSVATVEATTCEGNPKLVRIERFPMGESALSFNLTRIRQSMTGGFDKLPFDNALFTKKGTPRKRRRAGEAKSEDFTVEGIKKRAVKGISKKGAGDADWVFKVASVWKEEKTSNLAYCEMAGIIEADPLFSVGTEILLYGIPIPKLVKKYCNIAAGFFLVLQGKISVAGKVVGKRYPPPKDKWVWDSIAGEAKGSLVFQLKAELIVLSPKAIQAVASGTTGASVMGQLENSFSPVVMLNTEISIGGLNTKVIFKAAWGLIEYEREWKIFEPWKREKPFKAFDFNS